MLMLDRRPRAPMWLVLAGAVIALGVAAALLADADGKVDFASVPEVRLPPAVAEGEPASLLTALVIERSGLAAAGRGQHGETPGRAQG